jgi:hypothetical protein
MGREVVEVRVQGSSSPGFWAIFWLLFLPLLIWKFIGWIALILGVIVAMALAYWFFHKFRQAKVAQAILIAEVSQRADEQDRWVRSGDPRGVYGHDMTFTPEDYQKLVNDDKDPRIMKRFALGTVLSVTTGRLLCPVDDLYQILNYMTGDSLFTHQLPRAYEVCVRPLLAQFPQLADVQVPADLKGEDACRAWLTNQIGIYGDTFDVEPLESWRHVDPLAELIQMRDKGRR